MDTPLGSRGYMIGYTLGWMALGAGLGAVYGVVMHPGPQYQIPLGEQVARSSVFGAVAAAAALGTLALGVRMGAIATP